MDRIFIDGRRTQGKRTGVGHYAHSIIRNWPKGDHVEVLVSKSDEQLSSAGVTTRVFQPGLGWHLRAWLHVRRRGGLYFSPESLFVPILLGRRSLLTIHDLTPLDRPSVHTRWNVLVHRLAMRLAVARVGKIVVPTEAVKADTLRHFPGAENRTVVVYEGVREMPLVDAELEGFIPLGLPYVLYIGTIEPRKNVLELARTFLTSGPEGWHLVLAGKRGWLSESEREEFRRLCENPRISHLGFVPDSWIPRLLSDASVFCYVSEAEGFGLPVAEAMAAGVPVIHSDDPALVEVANGAGLMVRRNHLRDDLKLQLAKVASMSETERRMVVDKGLESSHRFDWSRAASSTRALLVSLRQDAKK